MQDPDIVRQLEDYKKNRADILAQKQAELIESLDESKIKEMSGLQAITGVGILYDKERLERGQSTEIVDVRSLSVSLAADLERLEAILRANQPVDNQVFNNEQQGDNETKTA